MRKKILAALLGILIFGLFSGTALAGNHGPIDFTSTQSGWQGGGFVVPAGDHGPIDFTTM